MSFVAPAPGGVFAADIASGGLSYIPGEDGDSTAVDSGSIHYVCASGGYIYYYASPGDDAGAGEIRRADADGKEVQKVADAPGALSSMYVSGSSIYCAVQGEDAGLYEVSSATGDARKLADGDAGMINAAAGRIFFRLAGQGRTDASIMSVLPDGGDLREVCSTLGGVNFYSLYGDHIYFTDNNLALWRTAASGESDADALIEGADISAFNIAGDSVYCVVQKDAGDAAGGYSESLSAFGLDGHHRETIAEGLMPGSPINIAGGRIYYFGKGASGTPELCRIGMDGTGKKKVKK
jgi:hypothetical protein